MQRAAIGKKPKTERNLVCLGFSSWIQYCYLLHSHCAYVTPFLSPCLSLTVSPAVIRQFMDHLLWDASTPRSHGLVWSLKTLAWLRAKLSWHLDWQDCKRTGWEGEVMLFSLPRSLSSLPSLSLFIVAHSAVMMWMWLGRGGGVEWRLPSSSANNRSLCVWPAL